MGARITSFEQYKQDYKRSIEDPESFWADIANEFTWKKKWDKVLEWDFKKPDVKWFIGGKLNITENCLDRHLGKTRQSNCYYMGSLMTLMAAYAILPTTNYIWKYATLPMC